MRQKRIAASALFVLALGLIGLGITTTARAESAHSDRFVSIKRLIDDEYAKDNRGGLTFGLIEDGKLAWTYRLGFAEERSQRATVDSIYPIASATKMLTGLMLLQLVERGQVHLSDPVEKYVPEIKQVANPFPWSAPITLMQLATMTAGFQSGLRIPDEIRAAVNSASTWEQKIALVVPSLKLQYEPGTARRYSNSGYAVLGLALSRAAKRPYSEYVSDEILRPLQMTDSAFVIPPEKEERIVFGYALNSSDAKPERAFNSPNDILLPAAGLLTTVGDLAKLMQFQISGGIPSVLSDAALQSSYQLLVPSDGNLGYGDGVGFSAVRDADTHLVALGHGGVFSDGFIASYEFDRSSRTGVILLANTYGGRAQYKVLVRRILALLNPQSTGGSGLPPLEQH
jgi:CubicO group peptidase (beta-lactamase class C family)